MSNTFIPEWQASEAVFLAWPNEQTDWAPWLSDVRETYLSIIRIINASDAGVVLLCREQDIPDIEAALPEDARVLLICLGLESFIRRSSRSPPRDVQNLERGTHLRRGPAFTP